MKTERITQTELNQYKITVPYEQSFINELKEFLNEQDSEAVLHVILDNHISTERQRIKRLCKIVPELSALDYKYKMITSNGKDIGHLFVTIPSE